MKTNCDYCKIDFSRMARHKIDITQRVEAAGDYGGVQISESTLKSVWAIVRPMKQFEKQMYKKLDSQVVHKIIVRYDPIWVDPLASVKYRITFRSRTLEIHQAIDPLENQRFIEIVANEVQS